MCPIETPSTKHRLDQQLVFIWDIWTNIASFKHHTKVNRKLVKQLTKRLVDSRWRIQLRVNLAQTLMNFAEKAVMGRQIKGLTKNIQHQVLIIWMFQKQVVSCCDCMYSFLENDDSNRPQGCEHVRLCHWLIPKPLMWVLVWTPSSTWLWSGCYRLNTDGVKLLMQMRDKVEVCREDGLWCLPYPKPGSFKLQVRHTTNVLVKVGDALKRWLIADGLLWKGEMAWQNPIVA